MIRQSFRCFQVTVELFCRGYLRLVSRQISRQEPRGIITQARKEAKAAGKADSKAQTHPGQPVGDQAVPVELAAAARNAALHRAGRPSRLAARRAGVAAWQPAHQIK